MEEKRSESLEEWRDDKGSTTKRGEDEEDDKTRELTIRNIYIVFSFLFVSLSISTPI